MGRPRSCDCGVCRKCKDRIAKKRTYDAMTPEERRAWKKRKDPLKTYATNRKARRRHIAKHPEKAAARRALQIAMRQGKIERQPCTVCRAVHGSPRTDGTKVKIEAHHHDYSKPLEVIWLCSQHHRPPWVPQRG